LNVSAVSNFRPVCRNRKTQEAIVNNRPLILAAVLLASTTAFASSAHFVATLAQPLSTKKDIIASGNIWQCEGSTCTLTSHPQDADSMRACHQLQLQVGALTAYGAEGKPFDADKLAKCNAR
jgi:hypothetical protein